jgi:hypothetical protein
VYEPVVVLPLLQLFLVELLPQILQNLPVVMLLIPFGLEEQIFDALALKVTCVGIA